MTALADLETGSIVALLKPAVIDHERHIPPGTRCRIMWHQGGPQQGRLADKARAGGIETTWVRIAKGAGWGSDLLPCDPEVPVRIELDAGAQRAGRPAAPIDDVDPLLAGRGGSLV